MTYRSGQFALQAYSFFLRDKAVTYRARVFHIYTRARLACINRFLHLARSIAPVNLTAQIKNASVIIAANNRAGRQMSPSRPALNVALLRWLKPAVASSWCDVGRLTVLFSRTSLERSLSQPFDEHFSVYFPSEYTNVTTKRSHLRGRFNVGSVWDCYCDKTRIILRDRSISRLKHGNSTFVLHRRVLPAIVTTRRDCHVARAYSRVDLRKSTITGLLW